MFWDTWVFTDHTLRTVASYFRKKTKVTNVKIKTIKTSSGSFEKADKIVLKVRKKKTNIFGTGRKGAIILHISEEFLKHKNQM